MTDSIITPPAPGGFSAHFEFEGEPISKSRARFTKRGSKMVSYTPEKTLEGERKVAAAFREVAPEHEPMDMKFYGVQAVFHCQTRQRRDVDNMLKLILDGLNKVAYPDDNVVIEVFGRKQYVPKGEARTEVLIYELGDDDINTKACEYCGELFRVYHSTRDATRFCGTSCAYEERKARNKRTCVNCGKDFQRKMNSNGTVPMYCSMTCTSEHKTVPVLCGRCGASIRVPQSWAGKETHYCSDDCRLNVPNCKHGHPWEENAGYRGGTKRYCKECNRIAARTYRLRKLEEGTK